MLNRAQRRVGNEPGGTPGRARGLGREVAPL